MAHGTDDRRVTFGIALCKTVTSQACRLVWRNDFHFRLAT
jgi:hypothetical protein